MKFRVPSLLLAFLLAVPSWSRAADVSASGQPVVLHIDASHVTAHVSPLLYGLMTEEINYSYDGGLYAELIRNRTFQDDARTPVHWSLVQAGGAAGSMALDRGEPLDRALPVSLRLDVTNVPAGGRVGVANDGYWGMAVRPHTTYRASFYAKAAPGFSAPITVALVSSRDGHVFAQATVPEIGLAWHRYTARLQTGDVPETKDARFVVSTTGTGRLWLDLVSLFPPTWNNRPNGNRIDLMQLLANLHPKFLRFPGGNYLQGRTLATRFNWKHTIGPLADRPGHYDDSWGYRSSDGMGLLEFLEWCQDLKMQPVLGVFAGFTLRGVALKAGPALQPYVQDALDEIEYVTGSTATKWGARRARDGHPAPFPLHYVEVGNEDFFDRVPGSYDQRFAQFYDAIKAKYPRLQVIATMPVKSRVPDLLDEHFYPEKAEVFESAATLYDAKPRTGPKIFVGEWATRIGIPTPNLLAAVSDAAWMTGLERNSDLVRMASYAPLFVNVSDLRPHGSMQWRTNLIGYDALHSYGSPSYYAQVMFSNHHGNVVLAASAENNPIREWQPPRPRHAKPGTPPPAPKPVPAIFYDATRDTRTGTIYVKLVNSVATPEPVRIDLRGVRDLAPTGTAIVLTAAKPTDTNSITNRRNVVPVTTKLDGVTPTFTRDLAPYSITVLVLHAR